jgi:hypothetical protein
MSSQHLLGANIAKDLQIIVWCYKKCYELNWLNHGLGVPNLMDGTVYKTVAEINVPELN